MHVWEPKGGAPKGGAPKGGGPEGWGPEGRGPELWGPGFWVQVFGSFTSLGCNFQVFRIQGFGFFWVEKIWPKH